MKKPQNNPLRFEATIYDGKDTTVKSLTRKELDSIDLKSFDCTSARCVGVEGFKNAKSVWCPMERTLCWTHLRILQAIQLNAGTGLDKMALSDLTGIHELPVIGYLPPRIWVLRQAFGETKKTQRLILTPDNGELWLMWPRDKTWIWVEIIRPESKPQQNDQSTKR